MRVDTRKVRGERGKEKGKRGKEKGERENEKGDRGKEKGERGIVVNCSGTGEKMRQERWKLRRGNNKINW
jgi:hypothetical protein